MRKTPGGPPNDGAGSVARLQRVVIRTPAAPAKSASTSQAMCTAGLVFTPGIIPLDPDTSQISGGDITTQTHQVMRNLGAALQATGSSLDQLVSVTVYLRDWGDFDAMSQVYVSYLDPPLPARACMSEICVAGGRESVRNGC